VSDSTLLKIARTRLAAVDYALREFDISGNKTVVYTYPAIFCDRNGVRQDVTHSMEVTKLSNTRLEIIQHRHDDSIGLHWITDIHGTVLEDHTDRTDVPPGTGLGDRKKAWLRIIYENPNAAQRDILRANAVEIQIAEWLREGLLVKASCGNQANHQLPQFYYKLTTAGKAALKGEPVDG
jgi:hypothetical protein